MGSSLQKIESRVEPKKGAAMIVHVLSGWLSSSYPIRCVFLQHISWRISVESVINKRKLRVLAISHGMARSLHGYLFVPRIRQWYWTWKAFFWIKNDFYQHQNVTIIIKGESETCLISEIAMIILSLKFIGSFAVAPFPFTNLFFPPSLSLLSSGRSLCCLPHFGPTASRKKRAAEKLSPLWAQCETLRVDWRLRS